MPFPFAQWKLCDWASLPFLTDSRIIKAKFTDQQICQPCALFLLASLSLSPSSTGLLSLDFLILDSAILIFNFYLFIFIILLHFCSELPQIICGMSWEMYGLRDGWPTGDKIIQNLIIFAWTIIMASKLSSVPCDLRCSFQSFIFFFCTWVVP